MGGDTRVYKIKGSEDEVKSTIMAKTEDIFLVSNKFNSEQCIRILIVINWQGLFNSDVIILLTDKLAQLEYIILGSTYQFRHSDYFLSNLIFGWRE